MATTAKRTITLEYFGDLSATVELSAEDNVDSSPGQVQLVTLAAGDNAITVPGSGTAPTAVTIVKPAGNAAAIKLKGAAEDTGMRLSDTEPDTLSLPAGATSLILNAGAEIIGVRLFWT